MANQDSSTTDCRLYLRVNDFELRKFTEAKLLGYSQRGVIERLIQCNGAELILFDKNNEKSVTLPKGFFIKKYKVKPTDTTQ